MLGVRAQLISSARSAEKRSFMRSSQLCPGAVNNGFQIWKSFCSQFGQYRYYRQRNKIENAIVEVVFAVAFLSVPPYCS